MATKQKRNETESERKAIQPETETRSFFAANKYAVRAGNGHDPGPILTEPGVKQRQKRKQIENVAIMQRIDDKNEEKYFFNPSLACLGFGRGVDFLKLVVLSCLPKVEPN